MAASAAPGAQVIGRVAEQAAVNEFLTAPGGVRMLVLEGVPGIGKSTIWQQGVKRARAAGGTVLTARPSQAEAGLSFTSLADLFGPVAGEVLADLPSPQRVSLDAALLRAPAPGRGVDERALAAAVLSMLRLLGAAGTVVVAVDDVQWLDTSSGRILGHAVRRLETEPVRLLLTARPGDEPVALADATSNLERRRLTIGPLSLAALHEVIKLHCGYSVPRPTLVRLAEVCDGNPFYALEIAAELVRRSPGDEGSTIPVPASVQGLLESRLDRLPAATRRALLTASALAQPTTELVDADALAPAEDAGIVSLHAGQIRFAHPLLASAVYGAASPSTRRRLHESLAGVVDDPEERARHLALAQVSPDPEIAAQLDQSAAGAASRGAPVAAAELVELAIALTPAADRRGRGERQCAAARYWGDSGDLARAQSILERALPDLAPGTLRCRALQLLGQLACRRSSFGEGAHLAERALRDAREDRSLRASVRLDLAYCCSSMGDLTGAREHAREAVAAAEAVPGSRELPEALGTLAMTQFLAGGGLDGQVLARALALEQPSASSFLMQPRFMNGLLLLWTGQVAPAEAVLDLLRTEVLERGQESTVPLMTLYLVWAALWRGDLGAAARLAEESQETAALLGDPAAEAIALSSGALVHAFDGDSDLGRAQAYEALALFDRMQWQLGTIWPRWALGLLETGSGNPDAVDSALAELADQVLAADADPALGVFLPEQIEALVELGRYDRAEQLLGWLERSAQRLDRSWALAAAARCRGHLLASCGDLPRALDTLQRAIELHDRAPIPLERARTLLLAGRVLRRTARRTQARAALAEALAVFEQVGAPQWQARCRAELDRLGTRAARPDALTPTEARIADLAVTGLSNKEIAEQVFISVKAVEANLTRVYRKVGVRSRTGLANARHPWQEPGTPA